MIEPLNYCSILSYSLTIMAGADYSIDIQILDDDDNVVDMSGWAINATARQFPEDSIGEDFICISDHDGVHLYMTPSMTGRLPFLNGVYDVFATDPSNNIRVKLAEGQVYIRRRSTR